MEGAGREWLLGHDGLSCRAGAEFVIDTIGRRLARRDGWPVGYRLARKSCIAPTSTALAHVTLVPHSGKTIQKTSLNQKANTSFGHRCRISEFNL